MISNEAEGPRLNEKKRNGGFPYWALIAILLCVIPWLLAVKYGRNIRDRYASFLSSAQDITRWNGKYVQGVVVDGIELGGLSRAEASSLFLQRKSEKSEDFVLTIDADGKQWRITSEEVPLTFNAEQILDEAFLIGHLGTLEERRSEIEVTAEYGREFVSAYEYDRSVISHLVEIIASQVDRPAKDAALDAFDPIAKAFQFTAESAGQQVDQPALVSKILEALDEERFNTVLSAPMEPVAPTVLMSDLEGHFGLVSSFSTQTTNDRDRNTNISISAAALSGRVVQPGETLSFNGCTGKRTGDKGYREAGAIAGGVLVDDMGGGVCQTSTTLFNAVVRADLEIVKRYAHSWPSSYVPRGEDATVNWPSRDFVFRNNTDYPVFLVAWYEKHTITVEVYGYQTDEWASIDLDSKTIKTTKPSNETIYTQDTSLPPGTRQAGHSKRTGYVVETYKIYYDAEHTEIRRVKLWVTDYPATQNEILFN